MGNVPAKKTTPQLSDLLKNKETEAPEVVEPEVVDDGTVLVDPSTPPVHTWEENHDQNLARLHPDVVIPSPPSEQSTVITTVTNTVYAEENENDDKGFRN